MGHFRLCRVKVEDIEAGTADLSLVPAGQRLDQSAGKGGFSAPQFPAQKQILAEVRVCQCSSAQGTELQSLVSVRKKKRQTVQGKSF
jgi:hypothetical protein